MNFDGALAGATFRAAICKRCGVVLAVAIDAESECAHVRVKHPRGSKGKAFLHEATYRDEPLMFWYMTERGQMLSCAIVKDLLVRVAPSVPPEPISEGGGSEGPDREQH